MNDRPHYPWKEGDALFADELNAAIANAGGGPYLPIVIGDGTGGPTLTLHGASGNNTGVQWQTASNMRWRFITDASDNLGLYSYNAAGAFVATNMLFANDGSAAQINSQLQVNYTGPVNATTGSLGLHVVSHNTSSANANAHQFTYYSSASASGFDIGFSNLAVFDPPSFVTPTSYNGMWAFVVSPNDTAHAWNCLVGELNITNRGADTGWMRDRTAATNTGGLLLVPEVSSFTGVGEGKNATWAYSVGHSGGNNSTGFPAKFYNGYWIEPNSIVGLTGRAIYATGDITGVASQYPYGPFQTEGTWLHGLDHTKAVYTDTNATTMLAGQGVAWLTGTTGTPTNICRDTAGNGSPEGVVTANKGSTYRRFDGGAATCFYVKESGVGNTGWVAK